MVTNYSLNTSLPRYLDTFVREKIMNLNKLMFLLLPPPIKNILRGFYYKKRFPHTYITGNSEIPFSENLTIGAYTYSSNLKIYMFNNSDRIEIGKFCSIASDVIILGGGEHSKNMVNQYPLKGKLFNYDLNFNTYSKGPVIIGNDVWIGTGAIILSGVKVGHGAIIGSGSVVTKDVEPYHIVAGNPAKLIGKRFSNEQISSLLTIGWWNWDIKKIRSNINYFDTIERFIEKFHINDKN